MYPYETTRMLAEPLRAAHANHGMPRQKRRQVRRHRNRSHPRSAASVRNRERLVQIQMADIGADRGRAGQAHLRVHVGAIHVYLAAVLMDDAADLLDGVLEDSVR
jgi:hypothetical protein